jgi:ribosomal protein S18 acetylase RimI-like enzyme
MLLASHAHGADDARQLGPLIAAAAEGCADCCDIAQALVEPGKVHDLAAFDAGGLRQLAVLEYLERHLPRAGTLEALAVPPGWTIAAAAAPEVLSGADPHALGADCRAEIIAVLEASYRETRDCPGLAGLRRTSDVLDGHFGTGSRARFWLLARRSGAAEGVCLVNTSPDGSSAELVYLGLAPSARGKGVARALLSAAMRACSLARIGSISLAVDAANEPAKSLYASLGFRRTTMRAALIRPLRASAR